MPRVELSGKRGWNRAVEIVKDDTDENFEARQFIKTNGRPEWRRYKQWLRSFVKARNALLVADRALGKRCV